MAIKLEDLDPVTSTNPDAFMHVKQDVSGADEDLQITVVNFLAGTLSASEAVSTNINQLVRYSANATLPVVSGENLTNLPISSAAVGVEGTTELSDSLTSPSGESSTPPIAATPLAVKTLQDNKVETSQLGTSIGSIPVLVDNLGVPTLPAVSGALLTDVVNTNQSETITGTLTTDDMISDIHTITDSTFGDVSHIVGNSSGDTLLVPNVIGFQTPLAFRYKNSTNSWEVGQSGTTVNLRNFGNFFMEESKETYYDATTGSPTRIGKKATTLETTVNFFDASYEFIDNDDQGVVFRDSVLAAYATIDNITGFTISNDVNAETVVATKGVVTVNDDGISVGGILNLEGFSSNEDWALRNVSTDTLEVRNIATNKNAATFADNGTSLNFEGVPKITTLATGAIVLGDVETLNGRLRPDLKWLEKTVNFNVVLDNEGYSCDGAITATLPTTGLAEGQSVVRFIDKNDEFDTLPLIVDAGTEAFKDGGSTFNIDVRGAFVEFTYLNSLWEVTDYGRLSIGTNTISSQEIITTSTGPHIMDQVPFNEDYILVHIDGLFQDPTQYTINTGTNELTTTAVPVTSIHIRFLSH